MRKRISRDIRWMRFVLIAAAILIGGALINYWQTNDTGSIEFLVLPIIIIVSVGLYRSLDKAKAVEFDNDFMYVIGKTSEEKIPLKNVFKIKMTMTDINNRSMWKIGYYDQNKSENAIRILPKLLYGDFDEFKSKVKAVNKNVKIQNWSHSFDFDQ